MVLRTHTAQIVSCGVLCFTVGAACGGGGYSATPATSSAPASPNTSAAGLPNRPTFGAPAGPVLPVDSNFGTVTLGAGFVPDPTVTQGRSGGVLDARTVDPACTGWIDATKPDHVFVALTALGPKFRILAHSTQTPTRDTTLVVQRPDGTYVCNDDASPPKTDPVIGGQQWAAGVYRIWLGSFHRGEFLNYRLAFTEQTWVTPDNLPGAPPK